MTLEQSDHARVAWKHLVYQNAAASVDEGKNTT